MSDETRTISIPLRRMTQAKLDSFLEAAADILRGYVFAMWYTDTLPAWEKCL